MNLFYYFIILNFLYLYLNAKENWIHKYKERNTGIHCFDDRDCYNLTQNVHKLKNVLDMDDTIPSSCKLNRCIKGYEPFKYFCENVIFPRQCHNFCDKEPYKLEKNNLNDCCLCLNIKEIKKLTRNECSRQNSDMNTNLKGETYCENDLLKIDQFCIDNFFCHETCNDLFGDGIFGNCNNNNCICYRKSTKSNRMKKIECDTHSQKLNVSAVFVNNLCLFSTVKDSLNRCNKYNCQTMCNIETGRCLTKLIHF